MGDSEEAVSVMKYAVDLWLSYADMEINLRQWKKATQVFDDALADPFMSKSGVIYESYARYCIERKRVPSAQKVFIKGLSNALAQTDVDRLWNAFLLMMHENGSPELSKQTLYEAMLQQLEGSSVLSKPTVTSTPASTPLTSSTSVSLTQPIPSVSSIAVTTERSLPAVADGKFNIASACKDFSTRSPGQLPPQLAALLELESKEANNISNFDPAAYLVMKVVILLF